MNPADPDVYFNTPGVASVRWDQDAKLVLVEWEGWADSTEFKELLDAEIRALQQHRGSRVLADCRQQKVINPADQERANREWLPRALMTGLKRFAVVLPKSGLAEMNIRDALGKVPDIELQVAYFATVEEARAWLTG
ncbi:MAG TPA: STAS/SEC14 domain-containing protein [Candidatus Nitrosotalea sp.]|nr:STAS/SEC14 domain-containing protein [Candidatus Nitrosotalea sp.]